jgi:hypothetical protein
MLKNASEVTLVLKSNFFQRFLNFVQSYVEGKVSLADGMYIERKFLMWDQPKPVPLFYIAAYGDQVKIRARFLERHCTPLSTRFETTLHPPGRCNGCTSDI